MTEHPDDVAALRGSNGGNPAEPRATRSGMTVALIHADAFDGIRPRHDDILTPRVRAKLPPLPAGIPFTADEPARGNKLFFELKV